MRFGLRGLRFSKIVQHIYCLRTGPTWKLKLHPARLKALALNTVAVATFLWCHNRYETDRKGR